MKTGLTGCLCCPYYPLLRFPVLFLAPAAVTYYRHDQPYFSPSGLYPMPGYAQRRYSDFALMTAL
ncbi:hypothetical protein KCP78_08045 [Salmonella enterica subsp. enterica]|nr:hypothetical protein KCP78_08045 [Salmonella enterica subsp. enterica]